MAAYSLQLLRAPAFVRSNASNVAHAVGKLVCGCALGFAVLLWSAPTASAAEPAAAEQSAPTEKPAPAAVPLAELSIQSEAATLRLREIRSDVERDDTLVPIDKQLPALTREIDARSRENARILTQRPALELLGSLERTWQTTRAVIDRWAEVLNLRIAQLDGDLAQVEELDKVWRASLVSAQQEGAPAELIKRAEDLLSMTASMQKLLGSARAAALRLQSRVSAQGYRVSEAVQAIRQARAVTLTRVLTRDSPALWDQDWRLTTGSRIGAGTQDSREAQWTILKAYAERRSDRILLHGALFIVLAMLLHIARRHLLEWVKEDPGIARAAAVVTYPIATALVLALMVSRWLYPQAPRVMWAIIGAMALLPTVLVLRRLAAPYLLPLLYAVVVFFFIDQVRMVTASIDVVPRLIFVAEMVGGTLFLLWFLRTIRRGAAETPPRKHSRLVRIGVQLATALLTATAIANAAGYVALSNLLGNAALRSMNYGLILYAVVEILDALLAVALRVRPLNLFGMVRRHRELLRRRAKLVLQGLALLVWSLFALDRLAIRDRVVDGLYAALTAELSVGAIDISLADLLSFVLAVWASFAVSRFVRFVLDEEIYPHAKLTRGLPYAISRTVHYAILVAGFFIAMGVIGVDMTKFTILAGAFTVGVGFGLQNIFNNFVSGLILLFERPVQVGDVIQMDDATGVVERIGIRASIVRTPNGSEVIVPNGKLISERLINWTLSDYQRGIDVSVSVVLGSDPALVIATLERVAADHDKVLKTPPPQALLTRLGPDWMGFELRAATPEVEHWMKVRSELSVLITAALRAANVTLR